MPCPLPLYQILMSSKITLFYSENLKDFQISETKESPTLFSQGRANFLGAGKENSFPPQQSEFVSNTTSGHGWIRTNETLAL